MVLARCIINLKGTHAPILTTLDHRAFRYTEREMYINVGDELHYDCPNDGVEAITGTISCLSTGQLDKKTRDLECKKAQHGTLRDNKIECANNKGTLFTAGYETDGHFIRLYDVCFDTDTASAIYSTHEIYGPSVSCNQLTLTFLL